MKYLKKSFLRPFENTKKFTTGATIYFALTVISALVFVFILGSLFQSLGIDPLNPDTSQNIDLQNENVLSIIVQNLGAIGLGALIILVASIIIMSITQGYFLRCIQSSLKNKYTLPVWDKWGSLFKKGFILGIIYLIYALIGALSTVLNVIPVIGLIISILVILLIIYMLPMISIFYAKNYKFEDAFNFREIFKKIFTWKYLGNGVVIFLIIIAISLVESLISGLLTVTIVLPMIIKSITYIYTGIFFSTAFARLYKEIK